MKSAYIVYAKRTAIGRLGGSLASVRVDDMLAHLFRHAKDWMPFSLAEINDVIVGNANQAGEDNRNLARMSSILAELPFEVPGTTINRLCGSSMDALIAGFARMQVGLGDCFLIGGAENMSRAPYVLSKTAAPFGRDQKLYDTSLGWRFPNPKMQELIPLFTMGETAEEVAKLHKISRGRQDEFAFASHQKALKAKEAFQAEIVPIEVKQKKSSFLFAHDEGPRTDTSLEKLQKLRPVFDEQGTVTAGNSSSLNDGAATLILVSEEFLKRHKLTPLVRISGAGVKGCHPNTMGLGPIVATQELCQRFGKKPQDFDVIELNEAFAAQSLACLDELELDPAKVNLSGGAIALGHPLGCSGARIVTTLIHHMQRNPQFKQGLATMCIGLGQGIAVSLENCQ